MSYALDANILLFAADQDSPLHAQSVALINSAVEGPEIVYLFWPTIMAFLRLATHPSVFPRPLSAATAVRNIEALISRPHIRTPGEQDRFWAKFRAVAADVGPRGNLVADAHLAALMIENGVRTIWTHDRDFRLFPQLEIRDPFAQSGEPDRIRGA